MAICALGKEKFEIKSAATQIATNEVTKMGTNPQNRITKFAPDGLPLHIQPQVQFREGAPTSTSPPEEDSCLSGQERFAMEGMEWTPAHLKVACGGESSTLPTKGRDIILSAKEAESLPIPIKLFLMMAFQIGAIGFPDKSYYQRNPFHSIKRFIEFPGGLSADGMREWDMTPSFPNWQRGTASSGTQNSRVWLARKVRNTSFTILLWQRSLAAPPRCLQKGSPRIFPRLQPCLSSSAMARRCT